MTTEKMTIHKALSELKIISERLIDKIGNSRFIACYKHSSDKVIGKPIKEAAEQFKSEYQAITDLIKRRNAIKKAVVLSNSSTKVNISGKEYTVAEAIELKNNGMSYYNMLKSRLSERYDHEMTVYTANSGDKIEEKAERYVTSIVQAQSGSQNITEETIKNLKNDYVKRNTYDVLDPINITNEIEKLQSMIDEFMSEVDSALSVSNAITVIEFEY